MPRINRFRRMAAAGLLSATAIIGIACTGGSNDPTATSTPLGTGADPTATAQPTATSTATASDIPVSNLVENLSSLEIIKAQEEVFIDLFENPVDSVVKIQTRSRTGAGEGSGWVWDTEGHIVTNYHVVEGATSIDVFFFDGREYEGRVIGFNSDADMAVVKIDLEPGDPIQPAELGNSSELEVGQTAVALGNPFGQDFSMTTGIVSAVGRLIPSGFSQNFSIPSVIQTDTAINPGNSGGPLLDIDGRVIGINTQIRSESGSSSGVGFAVPVDLAKRVVPNLIADGEHIYSYIGISGCELSNEIRDGLGVENGFEGAYITTVQPGTPAQESSLRGDSGSFTTGCVPTNAQYDGDLIVEIDGRVVNSMDDLIAYLALNTSPGDDIVLTVLRGGRDEQVVVTLTQRP